MVESAPAREGKKGRGQRAATRKEGDAGDEKESCSYGKREEKFTARVRETLVPGQSIKNVLLSRAEIIKVRISGRGSACDERRGKEMYDAKTGKGVDRDRVGGSGVGYVREGSTRMFEIFPRPTSKLAMGNLY